MSNINLQTDFEKLSQSLQEKTGSDYWDYVSISPSFNSLNQKHLMEFTPEALTTAFISHWNLKTDETCSLSASDMAFHNRQLVSLRDIAFDLNPNDEPNGMRWANDGSIIGQVSPDRAIRIAADFTDKGKPVFSLSETDYVEFKKLPNGKYKVTPNEPFSKIASAPDVSHFVDHMMPHREKEMLINKKREAEDPTHTLDAALVAKILKQMPEPKEMAYRTP